MKNIHWLVGSMMVLALANSVPGQSSGGSVPAGHSWEMPTNNMLVLTNATGEVRLLNAQGLVLEAHQVYQPRIKLADLSKAELQALLETKTGYATVTAFESLGGTNGQGVAIENQLQQIWRQGTSLADKIQTRLEILEDMRAYNNEIALLPGSEAAANQYAVNAMPINDRLAKRAGIAVTAAAQVEKTEEASADGDADTGQAEDKAKANYRVAAERVGTANDRAMIANGQTAGANQQVTDCLAKCAELSVRLAGHGIQVRGTPPFYPIPPLAMKYEVDAERAAK